jgi:uncharacterized Zn finger protein
MANPRYQKARRIFENNQVGVASRDRDGKIKTAYVPGSNGKRYHVILRRNGVVSSECRLDTAAGFQECKGNHMTVCYHSLAVMLQAAAEQGLEIALCDSEEDAARRSHISGKATFVTSHQAPGKKVWMVVVGESKEETIEIPNNSKFEEAVETLFG